MRHLFLPADQLTGETARIVGPDHEHLARVLRARPGEPLILLDNRGNGFHAMVVTVGKSETTAQITGRAGLPPEPPVHITVAQALGKADKFEQVIQHGTEAGASAFIPMNTERCVVEIPLSKESERLARRRQIAKGASEQSGRAIQTEVFPFATFPSVLREMTEAECRLLLHPGVESEPLRAVLQRLPMPNRLLLMVGPEGGWSPAEVSAARAANVTPVTLGPRILRTETAALVAISQILFAYE